MKRGICALVLMYENTKIAIRVARTTMFAIEIDESTAVIGSIMVILYFTKI
jgi:hypothetical protein